MLKKEEIIMLGFWILMLGTVLLIPLLMLGFGKLFMKKPPQKINHFFGYRTAMSMKNQDTWTFAHKYCGGLWFKWGWGILLISVLPMVLVFKKDEDTVRFIAGIVCTLQIIPLILAAILTENALKKTFDKNGNRKNG